MPMHDWTRVPAGIYHDFHGTWLGMLKNALNKGILPSDHYALIEQFSLDEDDLRTKPDILALHEGNPGDDDSTDHENSDAGLVVSVMPPKVLRVDVLDEEHLYAKQSKRIAIRHVSGDRIVAMIELVSPGNKSSEKEIDRFVEKAIEFLERGCHLLIIDPFPPTVRDPQGIHGAIWSEIGGRRFDPPENKPLTMVAYDAGWSKKAYVEPFAVGDILTDMPLLLTSKRYVPVPLEEIYNQAFSGVPQQWQRKLV